MSSSIASTGDPPHPSPAKNPGQTAVDRQAGVRPGGRGYRVRSDLFPHALQDFRLSHTKGMLPAQDRTHLGEEQEGLLIFKHSPGMKISPGEESRGAGIQK